MIKLFKFVTVFTFILTSYPTLANEIVESNKSMEDPRYFLEVIERSISEGLINSTTSNLETDELRKLANEVRKEIAARQEEIAIVKNIIQTLDSLISNPDLKHATGPLSGTLLPNFALSVTDKLGVTNNALTSRKDLQKLSDLIYSRSLLKNKNIAIQFEKDVKVADNPLHGNESFPDDVFLKRAKKMKAGFQKDLIRLENYITWDTRVQKYYWFKKIGIKEYIDNF